MADELTPEVVTQPDIMAENVEEAIDALYGAFNWEKSPQGYDYWEQVVKNLANMVGKTIDDF